LEELNKPTISSQLTKSHVYYVYNNSRKPLPHLINRVLEAIIMREQLIYT